MLYFSMKLLINIITVVIILIALSFLILGGFVNHYTVYDKASYEATPEFPIFSTLNEFQLLGKMAYGGITRDVQGNLIGEDNKTGVLCPTCTTR
jgi:hypothetical protein